MDLLGKIHSLIMSGRFGEGEFHRLLDDSYSKVGREFASRIHHLVITMKRTTGEIVEYPLVVKQQTDSSGAVRPEHKGAQFANEVVMYQEIIPFLQIPSLDEIFCPKMFYAKSGGSLRPEEDLLMLEDLSPDCYTTPKQLFLDFQHITLTLKKLGKFHSCSYRAKKQHPAEFIEKTKLLKIAQFQIHDKMELDYKKILMRGLQPLIDKNICVEILNKYAEIHSNLELCTKIFFGIEEPFATIIHGDFFKNNIFYKYDSDGNPMECAFLDFQLSSYASPALDLSFFLYMHTTAEMREEHWDEFLQIYWNTVQESCQGMEVPSFSNFLEEFSKFAVYGYGHCALIIPKMLAEETKPFEEMKLTTGAEFEDYFNNLGGSKASAALTDIVQHLYDNKYIQKFLEYTNKNHPRN